MAEGDAELCRGVGGAGVVQSPAGGVGGGGGGWGVDTAPRAVIGDGSVFVFGLTMATNSPLATGLVCAVVI